MIELKLRYENVSFGTLELAFQYLTKTVSDISDLVCVCDHANKATSVWHWNTEQFVAESGNEQSHELAKRLNKMLDSLPIVEIDLNKKEAVGDEVITWIFRNDENLNEVYVIPNRYLFDATNQLTSILIQLGKVNEYPDTIPSNCNNFVTIGTMKFWIVRK